MNQVENSQLIRTRTVKARVKLIGDTDVEAILKVTRTEFNFLQWVAQVLEAKGQMVNYASKLTVEEITDEPS